MDYGLWQTETHRNEIKSRILDVRTALFTYSDSCYRNSYSRKHPMTSRLLPTIFLEVLDNLQKNYEQRPCITELLLGLNSVFGLTLTEHALELIDDDSVFLIESHQRRILQVVGSRGDIYTIMESANFCTCEFFKHQVLKDKAWCCKHFLAAKVALILGSFKTKNETSEGVSSIVIDSYCNQELT